MSDTIREKLGALLADLREHDRGNSIVGVHWMIARLEEIERALLPQSPEGMVMVPREPTEAMQDAARDWSYKKYGRPIGGEASRECYRAMIAVSSHSQEEEMGDV